MEQQKRNWRVSFFSILVLWALSPLFVASPAIAQPNQPRLNTWVPNGAVNAIVANANRVFLGGDFNYIGPCTGGFVPINATSGKSAASFPKVAGAVKACISDGSGGWFIGGLFTHVGSVPRSNIAHILANGSLDSAWNPGASYEVLSFARYGSILYVGGKFRSIGDKGRMGIAALNAATGVPTAWAPYATSTMRFFQDGHVYVLAVSPSGDTVYAGGDFTGISGQSRNNIAAVNASNGMATSWNPNPDGYVYALALSGSTLYTGGTFTKIGGNDRKHVAALDTATGAAIAWNPNADGRVYSLTLSGPTLFTGGEFTSIGGKTRNGIASFNTGTGSPTDWNPDAQGSVHSIVVSGSIIYVGGSFRMIGGQARNRLAALDAATGKPSAWNPNMGSTVFAIGLSGSTVCAGGEFASIGGVDRNGLAAIDAATGQATSWDPKMIGNRVQSFALSGSTLYAVGGFTSMGGKTRNNIAAVDTSSGFTTSWDPSITNSEAPVSMETVAVSPDGGTVYAGGWFTTVGLQTRNNIAAIDAVSGQPTAWNPNADGAAKCFALSGSTVFAGGVFSNIGGQTRKGIAALDVQTGLASPWNPNLNGYINTIALSGSAQQGTLYLGGIFQKVAGQSRGNIAAIDAQTGQPTAWASGWNMGADSSIYSLAIVRHGASSKVYAAGLFSKINGRDRNGVAALDIQTGHATLWNPNPNTSAYTIGVGGSVNAPIIYVGGYFTIIGNQPNAYFAQFDPLTLDAREWGIYQ